ncbi:hypothetical protein GMSM_25270 [Geomonas sp. Red276]
MNNGFGSRGTASQAVEIFKRAEESICSGCYQGLCPFLRAGKADNFMAGRDKLSHYGNTNESRCTSNEYTHVASPFV